MSIIIEVEEYFVRSITTMLLINKMQRIAKKYL
jgi:hypothetical protein